MKYKVGDKVRVKKDLSTQEHYDLVYCDRAMAEMAGKVVTIVSISNTGLCVIKDDSQKYLWDVKMFEGLANEAPSITKRINNKHNILNGLTQTDTLKPDYYKYRGGDVFDMAKHFDLDFTLGNALKYLLRAGHKDPAKKVEDLNKCIECIKRHIELEGEG